MKNKNTVGMNTWGTTLGGPATQGKKNFPTIKVLKSIYYKTFLRRKNGGSMLKCIFFML